MTITFAVNITLSAADKRWLEDQAITPIVGALNGIRDAISSKEEVVAAISAAHARINSLDTANPKG